MTNEQMLAEIREANLTYLMLAQSLIRQDRAEAQFRLGLTEEAAELLAALSPAQIMKVASGNMLLCRFRVDDDLVWDLLTHPHTGKATHEAASRLGVSNLMGSRIAEAV